MRAIIVFFGVLLLLPLVNADVGPGPDAPEITIRFEKTNATYFGIQSLVYHCNETDTGRASPVDTRKINMTCKEGVCTNDLWFYKLNPCFYSSGYFSYAYKGKTMKTEWMNFTDSRAFDYTIDVGSGEITSSIAIPKEMYDICCAPSFILPVFLGLAFLMGGRND